MLKPTIAILSVLIMAGPLVSKGACQNNLIVSHSCVDFKGNAVNCTQLTNSNNLELNVVINGTCTSGFKVSAQNFATADSCSKNYQLRALASPGNSKQREPTCPPTFRLLGFVIASGSIWNLPQPGGSLVEDNFGLENCIGNYFESASGSYLGPPC